MKLNKIYNYLKWGLVPDGIDLSLIGRGHCNQNPIHCCTIATIERHRSLKVGLKILQVKHKVCEKEIYWFWINWIQWG